MRANLRKESRRGARPLPVHLASTDGGAGERSSPLRPVLLTAYWGFLEECDP